MNNTRTYKGCKAKLIIGATATVANLVILALCGSAQAQFVPTGNEPPAVQQMMYNAQGATNRAKNAQFLQAEELHKLKATVSELNTVLDALVASGDVTKQQIADIRGENAKTEAKAKAKPKKEDKPVAPGTVLSDPNSGAASLFAAKMAARGGTEAK